MHILNLTTITTGLYRAAICTVAALFLLCLLAESADTCNRTTPDTCLLPAAFLWGQS
jgi:hypothetical protein